MIEAPTTFSNAVQAAPRQEDPLREQAIQLEAFMFAELLRVSDTGISSPDGGGDSQFDSFLRQTQAEAVARSGQTGLAESIYQALIRQEQR
ncbi:Rod binding protein [Jannaschia seosinensis]|uniref:Rod binding protein n=1 Tax=Jannaschia seosinensis TaxID=313367 RepID=A0A0M7B8Q0_9RHOB|nr:hypothetical protein [Jannaschia seosinensis]CUH34007.1 Rod binding protein [Jannaschia seosinensis]